MQPACSFVIVNWNSSDVLEACVESIRRQEYSPAPEIVVIDNASNDGSVDAIRALGGAFKFIESPVNLGFGKGNNRAFEEITGELVFFLNPDTELQGRSCLSRLAAELRPGVGLVGPRLLNSDGSTQASVGDFRTPLTELYQGLGIHRFAPDWLNARLAPEFWSQSESRDVDWVKGAAVLMRAETFKNIRGFDESNFMYAEDMEICLKVHRQGLRVRYATEAEVLHLDDHSSSKRWSRPEKAAKAARAEQSFLRTNFSRTRYSSIMALRVVFYALRLSALTVAKKPEKAAVYRSILRSTMGR